MRRQRLENLDHQVANGLLVVDDEDRGHRSAGPPSSGSGVSTRLRPRSFAR
jgi:hypothetical protein